MQPEIDKILSDMYTSNKKLAEEMVGKKMLSAVQLKKLLGNEPKLLGQLLIEEHLILQYELKTALVEQKLNQKKLGEILVEKQAISSEQLAQTLRKQACQVKISTNSF